MCVCVRVCVRAPLLPFPTVTSLEACLLVQSGSASLGLCEAASTRRVVAARCCVDREAVVGLSSRAVESRRKAKENIRQLKISVRDVG